MNNNNRLSVETFQLQNRRIAVLDNLLYEYNRNMREYNQNIHGLIQTINNIQPPLPIPAIPRTNRSNRTTANNQAVNSASANSQAANSQAVNSHSSNSSAYMNSYYTNSAFTPTTPTNQAYDILSYFIYPMTTPTNNLDNNTTDDQINIATESILFHETSANSDDVLNEPDNCCPITMERYIEGEELLKIKYCGHTFKKNALLNWLHRDPRCPLCRYNINDAIEPANHDTLVTETLNVNPYENTSSWSNESTHIRSNESTPSWSNERTPIRSNENTPIRSNENTPGRSSQIADSLSIPTTPPSPEYVQTPTRPSISRHASNPNRISNFINTTINNPDLRVVLDLLTDSPQNYQLMQNLSPLFSELMTGLIDGSMDSSMNSPR